jgi:hypothetical protein
MDIAMIIGIVMAIVGALPLFLKIKLFPMPKNVALVMLVAGLFLSFGGYSWVSGLLTASPGMSSTTGMVSASGCAFALQVQPAVNSTGQTYDSNAKRITQAVALNTTSDTLSISTIVANYVLARTDLCSNEYASFPISVSSGSFVNSTTGLSYNIITADAYGQATASIIVDGVSVYNSKTQAFTPGQTKTMYVSIPIDAGAIKSTRVYESRDITISIAGQNFVLSVLRTADLS